MKQLALLIVGILSLTLGCSSSLFYSAGLIGLDDFKDKANCMEVKGLNGVHINMVIRFGPFFTGKFTPGMESEQSNTKFKLLSKSEEVTKKHSLHFIQRDSLGDSISVTCLAQQQVKTDMDRTIHIDKRGVGTQWDNAQMQVVRAEKTISLTQRNIERVVLLRADSTRAVTMNNDTLLFVRASAYDNANKHYFNGLLIKKSGETFAAYTPDQQGRNFVWMRNDIQPDCKLFIAALITSIIMLPAL